MMKRMFALLGWVVTFGLPLSASLQYSPPDPVPGQTVTFTAIATGTVHYANWNFGDGNSASHVPGATTTHVYSYAGTYTVTAAVFAGLDEVAPVQSITVTVVEKRRILVTPDPPLLGVEATFRADRFVGTAISWDMGDGTQYASGGPVQTHRFTRIGTFIVSAREVIGRGIFAQARLQVTVRAGAGPLAPFAISYLLLHWADGTTNIRVGRDFKPLIAYADLKFEGSGAVSAQWLVDGQVVGQSTKALNFGEQASLDSGEAPPLPTMVPGRHVVSLRFLRPALDLAAPEIEYFVGLEAAADLGPQVDEAVPPLLLRDKEQTLRLSGRRFTADTVFAFGGDISVIGAPLISSSEAAEVKVFVTRAARDGDRPVEAANRQGRNSGPGLVHVGTALLESPGKIKIVCPDLQNIDPYVIQIDEPETYAKGRGDDENTYWWYIAIDDSKSFRWTDKTGAPQFFELRFYDGAGKKLLITKRLPAFSRALPISDALIQEFFTALGPGYKPSPIKSVEDLQALAKKYPSPSKAAFAAADMQWEIVGLRTYDCPAAARSDDLRASGGSWPREVVIGKSTRLPLFLPDRWTGLNCPANGFELPGQKLAATDLDLEKLPNGFVDSSSYVGHRFAIKGTFDNRRSPIGASGEITEKAKTPPASTPSNASNPPVILIDPSQLPESPVDPAGIDHVDFDNVFIDWGDGTPLQPVRARLLTQGLDPNMRHDLRGVFEFDSINPMTHAYAVTGAFTIRLVAFPNGALRLSGKAEDLHGLSANDFVLRQLALTIKGGEAGSGSGSGSMTDWAYQMFCQNVTVTNRADMCAAGPLNLVDLRITGFPGNDAPAKKQPGGQTPPVSGSATTCDELLTAQAELTYFGRGSVDIVWFVDGVKIGTRRYDGLSSPGRQNLSKEASWDCSHPATEKLTVQSPFLPVDKIKSYSVRAEARVVVDLSADNVGDILLVENLLQGAKNGNPVYCAWMNAYIAAYEKYRVDQSTFAPAKMAAEMVLSQIKQARDKYCGSLQIPGAALPMTATASASYSVKAADPKKLCKILFPTKDGTFTIGNIQDKVSKGADGRYSGSGLLKLPFTSASDGIEYYAVPVSLHGWLVDESSGMLLDGVLQESPAQPLSSVPAVKAVLAGLAGRVQNKATQELTAALDLRLRDPGLRKPGNPEAPPEWKARASRLTADGDWIKPDSLPEVIIGWTSAHMRSDAITFDFSKVQGAPKPGLCSTGDVKWVGVDLGSLVIVPFTFNMVSTTPYTISADNWVIVDKGLCGQVHGGSFASDYQRGRVAFGGLDFEARDGSFKVTYNQLDIRVPWLETDLKGDAVLAPTAYGYGLDFSGVKSPVVTLKYDQFTLTARQLRFTTEKNLGWVIESRTDVDLRAENKALAKFTLPRLLFGFDARPYFDESAPARTIPLSGPAMLGDTSVDLVDCAVTNPGPGASALHLALHVKSHLSENPIVPEAPMQVNFEVNDTPPVFTGKGPWNSPFDVPVNFPLANPSIKTQMHPVYTPGGKGAGGGGTGEEEGQGPWSEYGASSGEGTRYYGDVDLGMFGGPPLRTQLLIGYQGGKSFFLVRADIPLGESGIPLSPYPFAIFRISGGLGYNFPVNAFKSQSIANAQPDMSGTTIFMAGLRVGSEDGFAFTLDGEMTVKFSGQVRMDFRSWLLTADHSGDGQFQGMFQYAGGSFDGRLWGGLDLLGGLLQFSLGTSEDNAAVDLHFDDSGKWHLYAGRKEGPRIQAKLLTSSTDSYMMLGSEVGLAFGGTQNYYLGVGDGSVASAYVKSTMDVGVQFAPGPRLSGSFAASAEAGVCALGACVDGSVSADITITAPPLDIRARASLDLPWPLPSVSFSVHL